MEDYIVMCAMYPTMTSAKVDKFLVKKGDKVIVRTGRSKGKTGEVLKIFPKRSRAIVQGVNLIKRHTRPTQNTTGGIIEQESTIVVSNIRCY